MNRATKIISVIIAAVMILSLASCTGGTEGGNQAADPDWLAEIKTLNDAFNLEGAELRSESYYEGKYVYVFDRDAILVRVYAEITQEQTDALDAIDFFDEQREAKTRDIVGDLPVKVENLSSAVPDAAKLAGYVGKTGQEMMDMGFDPSCGWNLDENLVYMAKGLFDYAIYFDNEIPYSEDISEDDVIEAIKDNTVRAVEFFGLSASCDNLEYTD